MLSLILGLVGVTGQLVASTGRQRAGWAISLAGQPLWVVFAVVEDLYGLLLLTAGYTFSQYRLLRQARNASRGAQSRKPDAA